MNQQGISVLKILYIVSICVIILVVNILIFNNYKAKERDAVRIADMAIISSGFNQLYTDQGSYNLGENCQVGMFLKDQNCMSLLTEYINTSLTFQDPFENNTLCTADVCSERICEYSIGVLEDDSYAVFFHLEKGIAGISAGCHYLDQTGIH